MDRVSVIGLPLGSVMSRGRRESAAPASRRQASGAFGDQLRSAVKTADRQSIAVASGSGRTLVAIDPRAVTRDPQAGRVPARSIPPMPRSIANPNNLYNDVYGDIPPLAWNSADFHSRMAWIQSQVGFRVTSWDAPVNQSPGAPPLRTSTMFHAEVSDGVGVDFDVRSVMEFPEGVVATLSKLKDPHGTPPRTPYPGFLAMNPTTENPVGAAWTGHAWTGRQIFHASAEDSYKPGDIFETPDGRYQKVRFLVQPGSGPSGVGGEMADGWEKIYSR